MNRRAVMPLPKTNQLSLNLETHQIPAPLAVIPPEAVRTLADLLLGALGIATDRREASDESENQR